MPKNKKCVIPCWEMTGERENLYKWRGRNTHAISTRKKLKCSFDYSFISFLYYNFWVLFINAWLLPSFSAIIFVVVPEGQSMFVFCCCCCPCTISFNWLSIAAADAVADSIPSVPFVGCVTVSVPAPNWSIICWGNVIVV